MIPDTFKSKRTSDSPNYLYLCTAVSMLLVGAEIFLFIHAGSKINYFAIIFTLICGPCVYFYSKRNSIEVKDGTIYYKGMSMFKYDNEEIRIADITDIKKPTISKYGSDMQLWIVAPGKRADINPGRYRFEDIRTVLRIIHESRPDLSIPAFWLDENINFDKIRRSMALGKNYR